MATLTDESTQRFTAPPQVPRKRSDRRMNVMLVGSLSIVAALVVAVALARGPAEPPPATGSCRPRPVGCAVVPARRDGSASARGAARDRARPAPSHLPSPEHRDHRKARVDSSGSRAAGAVDYGTDIKPWLGKEAAVAVLNTATTTAGSLIVFDVRSRLRASAFLSSRGAAPDGSYEGVPLLREPSGTVLAFVRHYLVFGQGASVRASIDAAKGRARSLQRDPAYRRAAGNEPPDRVLDAYASVAGVRRVLAPRGGMLGALAALLDRPALIGAAVSVSAVGGGARIQVHLALDPALARLSGPSSAPFTPTLAGVMPSGSTLLFDVRGLARAAPRVLGASAVAGFAAGLGPLLRRLGAALGSEGVDVQSVTSIFSGETAVALVPSGAGRGPALVIVSRTGHEAATRSVLAQLEVPLSQLFPPPSTGPGAAPEISDVGIAGVSAHRLALAPGLQLDYAVFHGLVVVSTSLQALAGVVRHARSLPDDSAYQATLANRPDQVSSLLFADFSQLLRIGEQTGSTRGALVALAPDLEKIRAMGLVSTSGESDTNARLYLQIR